MDRTRDNHAEISQVHISCCHATVEPVSKMLLVIMIIIIMGDELGDSLAGDQQEG
jgi:hypothetical protein